MNGRDFDDETLSAVAHELRTSLAVIVGYAELLAVRDDPDTRIEAARMIAGAAERLRDGIDGLLAAVSEDAE